MIIMFCIVSKNFHPAHSYSINSLLEKYPQCYLDISLEYLPYIKSNKSRIEISVHREHEDAVFINPDKNMLLDLMVRRIKGMKSVVWVHEPEKNPMRRLRHVNGIKGIIKLCVLIIYNQISFLLANKLVVFSKNGFRNLPTYAQAKAVESTLPFIDLARFHAKEVSQHTTISYIGTVAVDHAFEEFCNWVDKSNLADVSFKVYTRSRLSESQKNRLGDALVWSGKNMSSEYIANAYAEADFVWCNYKVANQSGVLPMALMWSTTPLISQAFKADAGILGPGVVELSGYDPASVDLIVGKAIRDKYVRFQASRELFLETYDISNRSLSELCYV